MNTTKTKRIVLTALFAAITCVATMIIKIPSPLKGYINIGDAIVLLCGWLLPDGYAFLAAGIGSALADVLSGYIVYAPATFIIKGLMALLALYVFKLMDKKVNTIISRVVSGITSELFMIFGYFLFEGVLYGFVQSAVNIPSNAVQGVVGIVLALIILKALEKSKALEKL